MRNRTTSYSAGAGDGPFFVTMARAGSTAEMAYGSGNAFVGDWGGQKTLWYVDPALYQGRALVRGQRIDGPGEIRFDDGSAQTMTAELQLDIATASSPTSGAWPSWITATRIRLDSPGCYAFQVDGSNFTEIIVFQADRAF